jgi:hypothetical protein
MLNAFGPISAVAFIDGTQTPARIKARRLCCGIKIELPFEDGTVKFDSL